MKSQMNRLLALAMIMALSSMACDKIKEATGTSEETTEETTSTDETTEETTEETTPEETTPEETTPEETTPTETTPAEEEEQVDVNEAMFILAYYETTCVQANVNDPAEQEKIITEIRARYGFDEDSYKAAADLVGEKPNVKLALEAKMKGCTADAAKSFLKAGAGAADVEGGCPDRFRSVEDFKSGEPIEVTCKCTKEASESGPLWGTGTYTTDSSICKAAVHAGVIKAGEGGEVTAKGSAGCETYAGTEANGLTSSKWGSYPGSFFFPSAGEAKCADEEKPDEKKPEVKKPVRKYTVGKYVDRGLRVGDIQGAEITLQFTESGKVKGFFKGKREGKFFNMPLSGSVSASSGKFTARGKQGRNNASISGGVNKKSATGNISGKINSKGFKIRFTAKN